MNKWHAPGLGEVHSENHDHETVFIDDGIHDWSFREDSKTLVYYSHALRSKRMCEYEGDEPERCDICSYLQG